MIYRDYNHTDEINSHGFLTSEFPLDSHKNGIRFVGIGNFFAATSMFPCPERFGEQLSTAMSRNNLCCGSELPHHFGHRIMVQIDMTECFNQVICK